MEDGDKVWENGKKSWVFLVFFFSKLQQAPYKWFFLLFWSNRIQYRPYACSSSLKTFCFWVFRVSIDRLFDNLWVLKKKLLFLKKIWKNSWSLDPKIRMNPVPAEMELGSLVRGKSCCEVIWMLKKVKLRKLTKLLENQKYSQNSNKLAFAYASLFVYCKAPFIWRKVVLLIL